MGQESSKVADPVIDVEEKPSSSTEHDKPSEPVKLKSSCAPPPQRQQPAPMSTKRPGGSGMAVLPQRRLFASGDGTGKGSRNASPSAHVVRKQRSEVQDPAVLLDTASQVTELTITLTSPRTQRREARKQELVQKLQGFVRRTPSRQHTQSPFPSVAITPSAHLPSASQQTSWLAKLTQSKQETLSTIKEELAKEKYYEPLTQEQVGEKVERSLGDDLETFASYQGTIHSMVETGLKDDMLDSFLFDEEAEQQLTTYEKWAVIRQAAEQVLQVYANRSNSSWIEAENWQAPTIVDANAVSSSGYANAVDRAISRGEVALLFIDDGRLCERAASECGLSPLLSTDMWQAIKELAPHRVPSTQRLERLSVAGRHLLHASVAVETWYGADALRHTKAVVAVDSDQEHFLVGELQQWNYFGFAPNNLAVLPLPRFHGFAEDQRMGRLAHVKNSAKLMMGTGYAMFLLNSPADAYTLSEAGEPQCLQGSVLGWLQASRTNWLFSGLFSDIERLRPEALMDVDFLAAALYCAERGGCNMAMDVVLGETERDVRTHDSLVLRRAAEQGGNCSLRASSMRTVKSYQIIQQHVTEPHGFYLSTQRYAFKVSALQQLLVDATEFHVDVRLHGFYAYATFDMADITTFPGANCACVLGGGLRGPSMTDVVFSKSWLAYAAPILEMQDKVVEFRQKAIELFKYDKLLCQPSKLPASQSFRERRQGFTVVIFLRLEHAKLANAALRLACRFVKNIVDKLHLVVALGPDDSRQQAQQLLHELGDKELEFQDQLVRETVLRQGSNPKEVEPLKAYCSAVNANLVVVPSTKLCAPSSDLGSIGSSMALATARCITGIPVLVVKANSVGRFITARTATAGGSVQQARAPALPLVAMVHLDTCHASPLVEAITRNMVAGQDVLYLAKTQAFERPGQLSMRSRRMFVQARMAAASALKVEERAYPASAAVDLPKAVEAEGVDLLVVSASGAMAPSKDVEELLRTAKTCIYIHRACDAQPLPSALVDNLVT